MLEGFENITQPLTEAEEQVANMVGACLLRSHVGAEKAVNSREICNGMNAYLEKRGADIRLTDARLRKIVNHLRTNDIVPCLVATSKGYYVSTDKAELQKYYFSLVDRYMAIKAVAESIERQINNITIFEA